MTRIAPSSVIVCVLSLAVGALAESRFDATTVATARVAGARSGTGLGTSSVTTWNARRRLQQYDECQCSCGGYYTGSYRVSNPADCNNARCNDLYPCDGSGGLGTAARATIITLAILVGIGACITVLICKVCGCCCFKKPAAGTVQGQQQYIATGAPVYPQGAYAGAPDYQAGAYPPAGQPYDAGAYGAPPPGYPAGAPPGVPPGKDYTVPPMQGNAVDGSFQQAPPPPPGYPMPPPYAGNPPVPQPGPHPTPQAEPYPMPPPPAAQHGP